MRSIPKILYFCPVILKSIREKDCFFILLITNAKPDMAWRAFSFAPRLPRLAVRLSCMQAVHIIGKGKEKKEKNKH